MDSYEGPFIPRRFSSVKPPCPALDVARGRTETGTELCRSLEEDDSARDGVDSRSSTPDQRTASPYCPQGQASSARLSPGHSQRLHHGHVTKISPPFFRQ